MNSRFISHFYNTRIWAYASTPLWNAASLIFHSKGILVFFKHHSRLEDRTKSTTSLYYIRCEFNPQGCGDEIVQQNWKKMCSKSTALLIFSYERCYDVILYSKFRFQTGAHARRWTELISNSNLADAGKNTSNGNSIKSADVRCVSCLTYWRDAVVDGNAKR